jgi:3-oxoacyl-ACP reductase-like protein
MSIFGDIMSAIFGSSAKAETPAAGTQGPAKPAAPAGASPATPSATPSAPSAPAASAAPAAPVDVAAVLDALAKKNKQKLNWRKSIVDLMKLLDLDSSQIARKKLAEELQYTGDTKDSAKMNVWLRKQVMIKLAANGGKVPADLKD